MKYNVVLHVLFCSQRPQTPRWGGTWEARYYRPACPQDINDLKVDIPKVTHWNISEDCLYMNIFAPNVS